MSAPAGGLERALTESAKRQLDAVAGTGLTIEWHVSNQLAQRGITKLFEGRYNINVVFVAP